MRRVWSPVIWAAYLVVIVTMAVTPGRGFVWCVQPDGYLRTELAGADDRCIHSEPSGEPGSSVPAVRSAETPEAECVDLISAGGLLAHQRDSTVHGPTFDLRPLFTHVDPPSVFHSLPRGGIHPFETRALITDPLGTLRSIVLLV